MSIKINSKTSKFVGGLLGLSMALSAVVMPASAGAATAEELQAQIQSLLSTIAALQSQLSTVSGPSTPAATGYVFSRNLKQGDSGEDVKNLQKVLNMNPATQVASSGAGSPGNETMTFGPATKAAVIKFQNMYASEVLAPVGLTTGTGFVGAATRAKLNAMSAPSTPTTPTTPSTPSTPAAVGTGLTVSAPVQPAPSLAPMNAARVPFTKVTLTAGADGDVRVNGIVVERGGPSTNSDIAGVVLLDENGVQLGVAKTLNSNNQAVLTEPLTIPRGSSRTFTIAANVANSSSIAGNIATLSVVGINTAATVTGSLPITGTAQTFNGVLSIGTATVERGSTDPGANQSKEIGLTGFTFSGVRVTAGSAEKIILKSVRWYQSGTGAASDLANVKTYVDGTAYDTTVSADGKYYTAVFGTGILIDKGFSKEITVKGDIISGSGRTFEFDIAKRSDVGVMGETYGFGIVASASGSYSGAAYAGASVFRAANGEDPWYDASAVTINAGTMTVSADTAVAAQNIAVNVANQPIGGFQVEVRGEPISVGNMVFNLLASGDQVANITSITLVDQNGAVVAGPVDGSGAAQHGSVTFSDTVTFPVGVTKLVLKGKLGTSFATNDTVQASTTPSSQWTSALGQTTNNNISPSPSSAVTASLMTVKAASLSISVSSQPTSRSVIAGSQGFEFARYIFDASQSGEDVRITSIPLLLAVSTVSATNLTSCALYDGSTAVADGSNVVNPSAAGDQSFTFNGSGLIVPKGSSKTISLKCNLSTAATSGTVNWGLTNNAASFAAATGMTSGQTVVETMNAAAGSTMTASTGGSYTVSQDTSITYKVAQAGATGVTLGAFQFAAGTQEDVMLRQIALELGNTASNSPADLVNQQVTLWHGSTQVGVAQFGLSAGDNATSTLSGNGVLLPSSGNSVTITVKADLAPQTAVEGTPGAFIAVNYDGGNNGQNGNYGVGASSGTTISGTSGDVTTSGVRIFRTVPTIAVTSNGGTLVSGGDLYKFVVTNPNSRDMVIDQVTFSVATTGGAAAGFTLYGDGVAANASVVNPVGVSGSQKVTVGFDDTSVARVVPANASKTYILRATNLTPSSNTDQLSIALLQDTSYPALAGLVGSVAEIQAGAAASQYFIWTPFSTTTPANTAAVNSNADWTNSYGLPGFPAVGQSFPVQTWTKSN